MENVDTSDHYDNPRKQTWRGWAWNQIADRLGGSLVPISTGLYLPGPVDRDREAALRKGFANENLIAIDLDENYVASVRRGGGLATCGRFELVFADIYRRIPIDFVFADYLGGLHAWSLLLSQLAFGSCHTVCINLMRGRDAIDACYLDDDESERYVSPRWARENYRDFPWEQYFDTKCIRGSIDLHRGFLLVIWSLVCFLRDGQSEGSVPSTIAYEDDYFRYCLGIMKPSLYSYLSPSGMVYDSVVFNGRGINPNTLGIDAEETDRQSRRIANKNKALLAVRTKKIMNN